MQMAKADRLTAIVLLVLGLAMLAGGWNMDRLEIRQIHPASIPGLLPMGLGALMAICAVMLWFQARAGGADETAFAGASWPRLLITAALCGVYALILIGWLPYTLATGIFVFAFFLVFAWPPQPDFQNLRRVAILALVLAVCVAFAAALLFQEVFLVRLP